MPTLSERVGTLEVEFDAMNDTVKGFKEDMRGLRNALIGFALAIAVSALGVSLAIVLTRPPH